MSHIRSMPANKNYRENFENVFGKKPEKLCTCELRPIGHTYWRADKQSYWCDICNAKIEVKE